MVRPDVLEGAKESLKPQEFNKSIRRNAEMEINLTIKNDDDDPDVARMFFTVDGTQGIGGLRLTSAESVELLGTIALLFGMHESQFCRDEIARRERLLKRYREQSKRTRRTARSKTVKSVALRNERIRLRAGKGRKVVPNAETLPLRGE